MENKLNTSLFKTIPALIKYKVSMAVTFTAVVGYIVFTGSFDFRILYLALGVFILAGGSSTLNQLQERKYDAKMDRTRRRPLPAGAINPTKALLISVLLIFTGLFLLYIFFNAVAVLLGLFNIIWYNLLYTNLKKVTPFAVVPGSLTGAVPVLIGWTAAGGYLFDTSIIFIAFFLFIWQIPHFWLLMLKYAKEYETAGFPTISQVVNPKNLKMIIFSWIMATSVASVMVTLFMVNRSLAFFAVVFLLNILFVGIFTKLTFGNIPDLNLKKSFISINVYMFIFMIILVVYHLGS